jgi:hypothetical protein
MFITIEFRQPALESIDLRVENRLLSRSKANSCGFVTIVGVRSDDPQGRTKTQTFPLFPIRALRCEVLFPGAAVASITAPDSGPIS